MIFRKLLSFTLASSMLLASAQLICGDTTAILDEASCEEIVFEAAKAGAIKKAELEAQEAQYAESDAKRQEKANTPEEKEKIKARAEKRHQVENFTNAIRYAFAGSLTFCAHQVQNALAQHPNMNFTSAKIASPVLLGASAMLFAASLLTPWEKYVETEGEYYFYSKEEVRNRNLITKLVALCGLAIAGGAFGQELEPLFAKLK